MKSPKFLSKNEADQAINPPPVWDNVAPCLAAPQDVPKLFDIAHLLTSRQLADRLMVDLKKVYRMVESNEIPGLRVGQQWRFIWEDVLGSLKERSSYGNKGP